MLVVVYRWPFRRVGARRRAPERETFPFFFLFFLTVFGRYQNMYCRQGSLANFNVSFLSKSRYFHAHTGSHTHTHTHARRRTCIHIHTYRCASAISEPGSSSGGSSSNSSSVKDVAFCKARCDWFNTRWGNICTLWTGSVWHVFAILNSRPLTS